MKKQLRGSEKKAVADPHTAAPPQFLPAASAIISMMYISGIIILMLPENICDRQRAIMCAQDIFSASGRVAVLSLLFAAAAQLIRLKYPDEKP